MQRVLTLYDTTIGKKAVMAVTGLVLLGFVIGHMLGNLQVYLGPQQLNGYAEKLHAVGPLLWMVRGVLLVAFVVHFWSAFALIIHSWGAREQGYRKKQSIAMSYSGPLLLLFVAYHLAHFTYPGIAMDVGYEHSPSDVYANVVSGFSVPLVAGLYVAAQVVLGLHLSHGAWSLLQTLGVSHPRYDERLRRLARGFALFVAAGNITIPLAVLCGLVR
jgi:succinate dehydrogenase / fumarate reductase cytochrome b subunit